MNAFDTATARVARWLLLLLFCCAASVVMAAQAGRDDAQVAEGERAAEAALGEPLPDADADADGEVAVQEEINLLELLLKGGYLMLPIVAVSILVVTFFVERWLGLRRSKVLPPKLISGLGAMAQQQGGLDPRRAYKLCQQYPSAAANVIRAMLLKVGRPLTEVEHAVAEASNREAARLYANVRWLSLAAGVAPLMGLLGTVWGMIKSFFVTANLPIGVNKAEPLAAGIYVALVTTLAGLMVAIPAAIAAHLFEGRIQRLFRELDETLLGLMPQLERFEGRLRPGKDAPDSPDGDAAGRAAHKPPAAAPK